jgi:5-methyltetrahydropteroyltriglutamate--homocysteine methyltransferase
MADRILTTHAGSLPPPTDLIELMWAKIDGQEVDRAQLEDRMRLAVAEVVAKQRDG